MGAVHLVRHGEVENPDGVIYGRLPGFGLSAEGREQAARTAAYLARQVDGAPRVVASPLLRAEQTARILMEPLGVDELAIDERLTEAMSGLEGLPRRFTVRGFARRFLDPGRRKEAERPGAVARRVAAAVRELRAETDAHRDLVIVSHQFPIAVGRVALERGVTEREGPRLVRAAPWLFMRGRCGLASVTTLRFDASGRATRTYWEPGRDPAR
ncbi:MAG: histidine phosphatase family protein [Sandaracinaceae bacterium]|nr:histidine phosphatase family protein [Sandaracinaceae bacterium]